MATTFITNITQVTIDGESATLVDETPDYGVGDNAARNTLALFLFFYKRDAENNFTEVTGIDNSTPEVAASWLISLASGAGAYRSYLAAIPLYDDATAYEEGEIVYFTDDRIYQYDTTGHVAGDDPSEDGSWVELTLEQLRDLVISDPTVTNYEIGVIENFDTDQIEKCIASNAESLGDEIVDGVCKTLERALPSLFESALLNAAWIKHYRKKNAEAEEIVDFLQERCC